MPRPRALRFDDSWRAARTASFREDLFYRLNVFPIVAPPLRDRFEDIPALIWRR
jgi:transcriptional regulator with GAF, ATPase, and Fis domain